jgi:hypothetical protein
MKRGAPVKLATSPAPAVQVQVQPSAEHAALALREAAVVMEPLARWLLRSGVSYPAFADMLKPVFLEAARGELERSGTSATQSALSMLSGLHRKDVRAFETSPRLAHASPRPSLPSQVFTRWLSDPRYRGAKGKPRVLPRMGAGRTFETLCRELSSDVHPRTVLDELVRLGLAGIDGENVVALANSFLPATQLSEVTALVSANVADHIAAAVSNITTTAPKSLEQSIFADGLTPGSVAQLQQTAREVWAKAFESVVVQARQHVDRDADAGGDMRMRFGVYFYSEPAGDAGLPDTPPPPKTSAKPRRARPRSKP